MGTLLCKMTRIVETFFVCERLTAECADVPFPQMTIIRLAHLLLFFT
jgi:hypothetical protein